MTSPRNAELEDAILEAPESPDAYLVYGDWLLEHGEPLGELVTVQATLAKLRTRAGNAKEKNALARREKALRTDAEARLGALRGYEHTWSFGFLESLILPRPTPKEYEAVLADPAARFLRELDIEELASNVAKGGVHPAIAMLARLGVSPALRKLALLAERRVDLGRIPPELWERLASIEELTIKCGRFDPGRIVLPRLVTLALGTTFTDPLLAALLAAEWPKLDSVQLDATAALEAAQLRPLLAKWAGALRHLGVTEHDAGNELVELLLATGAPRHLTSLDLSRTRLTDEGAAIVLAHAGAFEHLESFNLSENDLSASMSRQLERRFELVVDVEDQGTRDEPEEEEWL